MNKLAKILGVWILAACVLPAPWGSVTPAAAQVGTPVVQLNLGPGGAASTMTMPASSPATAGYATVNAISGNTPYGTAIMSVAQNNAIVSEVGVPTSLASLINRVYTGQIFIDYRSGVPSYVNGAGQVDVITGIAIANVGGGPASITLTLRDAGGNVLASGQGTLATGEHKARFVNQLNDIAPNFSLPANFATAIGFASLEISSNRQFSFVALRLTVNQRGETLYTTTPTAQLNSSGNELYLAQMTDGGGCQTTVILMNATNAAETGTIQLFADNGSPFSIRPVNGTAASSFQYSIPAGGFYILESDGSPLTGSSFSAQVIPDAGTSLPEGAGVVGLTQNGNLVTETGILPSSLTTHARIYVDTTGGHDTGVALQNPSGLPVIVTLMAFQPDGTTQAGNGAAYVSLDPNGHKAFFADQQISGLPPNFTGVLDISAPAPFAAMTVRSLTNSRGEFLLTTFPVADMNRTAPATAVFPQIAVGGGYVTQIVLLSGSIPSTSNVSYLGDTGGPLAVGLAQAQVPAQSKFH